MSFRVIIPSAHASNLIPCIQAIIECEPRLPPSSIIVVDDGAKAESKAVLPPVTWVKGKKPFIFARNVNIGIKAAGKSDVIVLGDDGRLLTWRGFTYLSEEVRSWPDIGVCSAGIEGVVCNPRQWAELPPRFREESKHLAFVCAYISRIAIDRVGLLDERFTGYGFEDFDYCRRVKAAGLKLAVWDGCVVDHVGKQAPSTFRTRPDWPELLEQGRQIYREKWGPDA